MFKPTSALFSGLLWYAMLVFPPNDSLFLFHTCQKWVDHTPHEKRTIQLTSVALCRKTPWRISQPQKMRQRKRLRSVDRVVDTVSAALQRNGQNTKAVDRWYNEMPREEEMLPNDKYTLFDKKEKKYRKGIHSECFCRSLVQLCWDGIACLLARILADTIVFSSRIAQVDASQPENQSSGVLNGSHLRINIESVCTICIYNTSWPGFLCRGTMARKRLQGKPEFSGLGNQNFQPLFIYSKNVLLTLVSYHYTCWPSLIS